MEKNRKVKILSIIALCVSLCALTIGFAAFSTTLTISSSANVTPSEEDFKIVAHGFVGESVDNLYEFDNSSSLTQANIFTDDGEVVFANKVATIDKLNISNVSVPLSVPDTGGIIYLKVANEGKYDAYFDSSQLSGPFPSTCSKTEDSQATPSLVDDACDYIYADFIVWDEATFSAAKNHGTDSDEFETAMTNNCFASDSKVCKLEKDSYLFVQFIVRYDSDDEGNVARADGDFKADFDPIELTFTTSNAGFNS